MSNEYNFYYFLGIDPPGGTTVVDEPPQSTVNTVSDTADEHIDGTTEVGSSLGWSQSIMDVELYGFAPNGDPILKVGDAIHSYFLLSDFGGWQGQALGSVESGILLYCFLSGTLIDASSGPYAIEELSIGDMIRRAGGGETRVKWIGRQTVSTRFGPVERLMPVLFAAGSLGDDLPHTDLTVTADHGMLVDGVICHAGALVNGTTITRVPLSEMGDSYTVYHVETEEHEIILANGAPAETFIDNVSRRVFDNFAEFETLYGNVPEMEELPYPRAMSARQVPLHVHARLAGKAVA